MNTDTSFEKLREGVPFSEGERLALHSSTRSSVALSLTNSGNLYSLYLKTCPCPDITAEHAVELK